MSKRLAGNLLAIGLAALLPSSVPRAGSAAQTLALPSPTGSFRVGTTVEYLIDARRADGDFPTGRPVTVQLWYPSRSAKGATAPYLMEEGLEELLQREKYYDVDAAALSGWVGLRTHSILEATPAGGKHPLLLFSVGLGVIRANYTSIAEELASQGTIVALVESPFQGAMVLPGGREILDTADRYGEPEGHRRGVADWSGDMSFALDEIRSAGRSPVAKRVAARVEWSQIAAAGHSSGGLVAVAMCERDRRVRTCVNLDGGIASPEGQPLADFVDRGLTKPALFLRSRPLYSDDDLARRGLTRVQWEKRGESGNAALATLASRSGGKLSMAWVAGTGHFSFSDAPFVMPATISRFGGKILPARQSWTIITRTLRAYLDRELRSLGGGLEPLARDFPELTLVPPNP